MGKGKVWTRPQKIALVSVVVAAIGVLATIIGLYILFSIENFKKDGFFGIKLMFSVFITHQI